MSAGKTRVHTFIKVILAIVIPVSVLALTFFGLCIHLHYYNDEILPTVLIDGVDVSGLTREETARNLNLPGYSARGRNAKVTVMFPDGSELKVTGDGVNLTHDAQFLVDKAFSIGRGDGFVSGTVAFMQRMYRHFTQTNEAERYEVSYWLDLEILRAYVSEFTDAYNSVLAHATPLINDDMIFIVKGARQVSACSFEVYDIALEGLLESLASGHPASRSYALPEANVNVTELWDIRERIYANPVSAHYDPETKTVSESSEGVDFSLSSAIEILNVAESGETVSFCVARTPPSVTREHLESLLFRDLIGECTTKITGTENRLNNIVLASAAVNSVVLESGEEFSFNRTVGRRTAARGYKLAPAFSGGRTVQATGGGICQVSSTIYSAIKDTGIQIMERHAHGKPVAYLPRGSDATVSWGTLDFKFVNNTGYPLRIDIEVEGRQLRAQVFGTFEEEALSP